ncbi:MAG: hypothetical protein ACD_78C00014G0001 [uncultured bacterium (gcode 4)]|uniref:Uncharacterized protein n=1 Tax=uncultured bacterium (gcode 4) TaxID=1234023 RepID=K1YE45_9BACT|nr:MAG: hypothetical protein ACD_78C00014G0001 [uncultured bacterium (gcode 4)]
MDDNRPIGSLSDIFLFPILFIFDISEYFLDNILKGDNSINSAMFVKYERYMFMGFLEDGQYTIDWLCGRYLNNLFKIQLFELLISKPFFLPDKSFSESNDIIDIVRGFRIDRNTGMTRIQKKSAKFQNGHIFRNKIHRDSRGHNRRGFGFGKIENILNLLVFMGFHTSFFMRYIDECLEFFRCHSLIMEIGSCSRKKTYESNKVFDKPVKGEKKEHKNPIYGRNNKRYVIGKAYSENLWRNLSKKENDGGNNEQCEGNAEFSRKLKLLRKIKGYDGGKTGNSDGNGCSSDKIRHKKTLILCLDKLKGYSAESAFFHSRYYNMVRDGHERNLGSCEKYKEEEEGEKYTERRGVHNEGKRIECEVLYRFLPICKFFEERIFFWLSIF